MSTQKNSIANLLALCVSNQNNATACLGRRADGVYLQDNDGIRNAALVRSFYLHIRAKGLTDKTVKDYLHRLSYLINLSAHSGKALPDLTADDLRAYIIRVLDTVKPVTINGRLEIWHLAFAHWLHDQYLDNDPTIGVERLKEDVVIKPKLTAEQLELLVNSFDKRTFTGQRNRAMVLTAVDTCARVGELVALRLPDVDLDECVVVLHKTKSHRDRTVPISPCMAEHLFRYISKWRRQLPGDRLFPCGNGMPMSNDRLRQVLTAKAKRLGWGALGPHCLRRTGAQFLHEGGMSVEYLRRILGHRDIRTTQTYLVSDAMGDLKDTHRQLTVLNRINVA